MLLIAVFGIGVVVSSGKSLYCAINVNLFAVGLSSLSKTATIYKRASFSKSFIMEDAIGKEVTLYSLVLPANPR